MFGIFMLGIIGCGCVCATLKNARNDGKSKQNSINNKEPYYMDWQGYYRRTDNDHKVCIHTTSMKDNWDKVDIDLKTGEVLRNYSQEERDRINKREMQFAQENKIRKEKAIKENRLWYSSYEITERGLQLDKNYPYGFVYRRVSDDLLINQQKSIHGKIMYDGKYDFILWRNEKEYEKTYLGLCCPTLDGDKKYNWAIIKGDYWHKLYNTTEYELEKYARENGAIL